MEKLIPVEEPTSEEKKAIEEKDDLASGDELMKVSGKQMFAIKIKRNASENSKG